MDIKKLFLHNNQIYTKTLKSKHSWEILDSIEYFRKNNIIIFEELKKVFPQQLKNIKLAKLFSKGWNLFFEDLKKNNHYLPVIKFQTDVIEFTDGLYFLSYNYFLSFYKYKEIININCYKYFDRSYRSCKDNIPINWLESISKTLKDQKVDDFCADLGRYFHGRFIIDNKKNTMCIVGGSNTGKTTLVSNIVMQIMGIHNVGIISDEDSFAFEQVEDKKVIVCDEFKFSTGKRSGLLKTLSGQPQLMDKKTEQKYLFVNKVPIMFLFNEKMNEKMLKDQAFLNRLLIYTFTYTIKENNKDNQIKKILEKELPQIMIYCNNLFFSKNKIEISSYRDKFFNKLKLKKIELIES